MRVYLDSCIVIYAIEGAGNRSAAVETAMRSVLPADFTISHLVRLECRVAPLRLGHLTLLAEFEEFFAKSVLLSLTPAVFDRAAELRGRATA